MNDRIAQALTRLFERHRIVFWYDARRELRADFDALELAGIEKLELTNNEFGIKHKILREQRTQKFLLYRGRTATGKSPELVIGRATRSRRFPHRSGWALVSRT